VLRAIGLLGGTFDPIHIGHLRIAIECRERLGLNEVKLLPAAIPPLKRSPNVGPQQRAAMVELAIAQVPGLTLDTRELQRQGVSYTVETLALIRNEIDADTALVWIMGTDSLEQLDRWHRWQDLLDFVNIAVLQRPGWQGVGQGPVAQWLAQHQCPPGQLCSQPSGGIALLEQPPLAISSTAVRAALRERKNLQFLLPAPVIEYISNNDLYTH